MDLDLQRTPFDLSGVAARGRRRAVIDREGAWSGDQATRNARAVAGGLTDLVDGASNASIGIDLAGGRAWFAAAAGAWYAGYCVVPISPHWPDRRRDQAVQSCDLIVSGDSFGALLEGDPLARPASTEIGLAAVVLETSGSSGAPKQVVHTRASAAAQARSGAEAVGLTGMDEWLVPLPASHAGGVGAVVRCLQAGAAIDFREGCSVEQLRELLSSSCAGATVVSLVPTQLSRLLDAAWSPSTQLKAAVIGGGPLTDDLRARALTAGIPIRPSWGMTEGLGLLTIAGREEATKTGSGRPIRGIEVAAEEGPAGKTLRVRGASISPYCVGPDGWFDTGDVGDLVEGIVQVRGRAGRMIITGGENVAPDQVAAALLAVDGVADARVFGEADPEWGQQVVAEVVLKPGAGLEQASLRRLLRGTLSRWEVPKRIKVVDAIERDRLGKEIEGG